MLNKKELEKNLKYYEDKVKNKNIKSYYNVLLQEYEYNSDFDFSSFINFMENNDDKNICKSELNKIRKLGTKKELPKSNNYNDYDYISESKYNALEKNFDLINQLDDIRTNALGIGTNKIKRRLNSLAETNEIAKALRLAIEIEDVNIQAKKAYGKYKNKIYDKKTELIHEMFNLFDKNKWVYGIHKDKGFKTNSIVFFELPNTEQISFHCTLNNLHDLPVYEKEWDGKINSTYPKLLNSIEKQFKEILLKK